MRKILCLLVLLSLFQIQDQIHFHRKEIEEAFYKEAWRIEIEGWGTVVWYSDDPLVGAGAASMRDLRLRTRKQNHGVRWGDERNTNGSRGGKGIGGRREGDHGGG